MRQLIYFLLISGSLSAHSKRETEIQMGVQTFEYRDESRDRPVVVEVWYPTPEKPQEEQLLPDLWIHPLEVRDAPLASRSTPYPLVLISHGHGGYRRDHTWLAERLVKAGFIVAAVDHYGNTRMMFRPEITIRFWERAKDISFALDRLLENPFFGSRIDRKRIGFAGYSLGGMTGLALAGGVAGPMEVVIQKNRFRLPGLSEEVLKKIDFTEASISHADPRISAFLLIAPANFVYQPEGLKGVKAPIGLVSAINDEVVAHKEHAYTIIQHVVPFKLKVLKKGISHYSFLNRLSDFGKMMLPESVRKESPCCPREEIHKEVADFSVRFFKEVWK